MYMLQTWVSYDLNEKLAVRPQMTFFYKTQQAFDKHGQPRLDRHRARIRPPDTFQLRHELRLYKFEEATNSWILWLEA